MIEFGLYAISYLVIGVISGVLAGLLGIGGGLIIVPLLVFLFDLQGMPEATVMHHAVATSLATIVFTSLSSVYAHQKHGAIIWSVVFRFTPGISIGTLFGVLIVAHVGKSMLMVCFGVYAVVMGLQLGLQTQPKARRKLPNRLGSSLAGFVVGAVSSVVGIGGGSLMVPFLLWCNVSIRQAIAISAACGFPIAVIGATGLAVAGHLVGENNSQGIGFVVLPALVLIAIASSMFAPIGARLTHSLPTGKLRFIFSMLLLFIGFKMLLVA